MQLPYEDLLKEEREDSEDSFVIDNDSSAAWAIRKMQEERKTRDRLISGCDIEIEKLKALKQKYETRYEQNTANFRILLENYFYSRKEDHRKTKTQSIYELPCGASLRMKRLKPKYERDEKQMLMWAKSFGDEKYIKVTESVNWEALKKDTFIGNNCEVLHKKTGEPILGLRGIDGDSEFVIDVSAINSNFTTV